MRLWLWLIGGALCATGALLLVTGGFGGPWGLNMNTHLDQAGADAVADIALTSQGVAAIACLMTGVLTLVGLNATAWKETGGY